MVLFSVKVVMSDPAREARVTELFLINRDGRVTINCNIILQMI